MIVARDHEKSSVIRTGSVPAVGITSRRYTEGNKKLFAKKRIGWSGCFMPMMLAKPNTPKERPLLRSTRFSDREDMTMILVLQYMSFSRGLLVILSLIPAAQNLVCFFLSRH
jgi:hypothetical protein